MAYLGHNSKKEVSKQWVKILCEEFWIQGEKEKCLGKPVSFLFDRDKIDFPASQVYFFKEFIISIVLTVLLKNFLYYNTCIMPKIIKRMAKILRTKKNDRMDKKKRKKRK